MDFVIDEEDWKITGLVVDTGTWLPGKKALGWTIAVNWAESCVYVDRTREFIKDSPAFNA
jgi:hypothetical protein